MTKPPWKGSSFVFLSSAYSRRASLSKPERPASCRRKLLSYYSSSLSSSSRKVFSRYMILSSCNARVSAMLPQYSRHASLQLLFSSSSRTLLQLFPTSSRSFLFPEEKRKEKIPVSEEESRDNIPENSFFITFSSLSLSCLVFASKPSFSHNT